MDRRALIESLISLVAAPAIVRASSLMPVRVVLPSRGVYLVTSIASGMVYGRSPAMLDNWFPDEQALHRPGLSIDGLQLAIGDRIRLF